MPEASLAVSGSTLLPHNTAAGDSFAVVRLGASAIGTRGTVTGIDTQLIGGSPAPDLERTLLEIGFIEGARIEILHEGPFGHDPIAVRVDDMCVALRRREASAILIRREQFADY